MHKAPPSQRGRGFLLHTILKQRLRLPLAFSASGLDNLPGGHSTRDLADGYNLKLVGISLPMLDDVLIIRNDFGDGIEAANM